MLQNSLLVAKYLKKIIPLYIWDHPAIIQTILQKMQIHLSHSDIKITLFFSHEKQMNLKKKIQKR